MEGEIEVTPENFFTILGIYNSKKTEFERIEFCKIIGVTESNTTTYKKFIDILESNEIVKVCNSLKNLNGLRIFIDQKKLEKFILRSDYYKKMDEFIHKCMWGALTP